MFTGVHIADGFLQSGVFKNVLVVSGEYITHLTKTAQKEILDNHDDRMACLTLGDSGAALMMELGKDDKHGFHDIDLVTLGRYSDCCIAKPTSSDAGGAIMNTDSIRIHAIAVKESVKHTFQTLKDKKWSFGDIKHYIMHQTAKLAISEGMKQFNHLYKREVLNAENMVYNLENRGNTSSTTHWVATWDRIHSGKIQNGDDVIFSILASGITIGSAPYVFDDLPERLREYDKRGTKPANIQVITEKKSRTRKKRFKKVRIESLGTLHDETAIVSATAIELARNAAEQCLVKSRYDRNDIDLLIHAGVHRDEFLCEPAIAALVAGELRMNDHDEATEKTFAYDIINGALSFLNACHNGVSMIQCGKAKNAMVVASEIENNTEFYPDRLLGLKETGSAIILDTTENDSGFNAFYFDYFTEHIKKYYSFIGQENGRSFLSFERDPKIFDCYNECIPVAVDRFLKREKLSKDKIKAFIPPQISTEFVEACGKNLGVDNDRLVNVANGKDYFTSSAAYGLEKAQASGQVKEGDLGLLVNVGTGIQVGCALYQF